MNVQVKLSTSAPSLLFSPNFLPQIQQIQPLFADPALVRFSQDSINATFKDGGSVADLAAGLKDGTINPSDSPSIRLVNNDGTLFTLDNRRLAAFQQAGVPIPYRMATPEEAAAQAWKFTTQNGGTSIRIRGQ